MRGWNLQDAKFMSELEDQSLHTHIFIILAQVLMSIRWYISQLCATKQNSLAPLSRKRSKRKPIKKLYLGGWNYGLWIEEL